MKSAIFLFVFVLKCTQKEHVHNRKWAQSALKVFWGFENSSRGNTVKSYNSVKIFCEFCINISSRIIFIINTTFNPYKEQFTKNYRGG